MTIMMKKTTEFSLTLLKKHFTRIFLTFCLLFPIIYWKYSLSVLTIKGCLLSLFLLCISILDWQYQMIYDRLLLPMLISGVLLLPLQPEMIDFSTGICAFALSGFLLVLRLITNGGIGGGDIKLAFVMGIWLGWPSTIYAALLAFWLGGLYGTFLILGGASKTQSVAFGPFLSAGTIISFLFKNEITTLYWSLLNV